MEHRLARKARWRALCLAAMLPSLHAWGLEIAYLPYFENDEVRGVINNYALDQWENPDHNLAERFPNVRNTLITMLQQKLERSGKVPAGTRLSRLGRPALNRMALNVLRRKGGLFASRAEEVAFMAKYIRDAHIVRWVEIDNRSTQGTDLERAISEPSEEGKSYRLNCSNFIDYTAYLAGLPADSQDPMQEDQSAGRLNNLKRLNTEGKSYTWGSRLFTMAIGLEHWRGWWKASYDPDRGPLHPLEVFSNPPGIQPGDLIVLYDERIIEVEGGAAAINYEFRHVEVVAGGEEGNFQSVRSIGNSIDAPHFSRMFSGMSAVLGDWRQTWMNLADNVSSGRIRAQAHSIFKFCDHPLPDTLALPD